MINALPPLPHHIVLSNVQRRAAHGDTFTIAQLGPVRYRGTDLLDEPRVEPIDDYAGHGIVSLGGMEAATLTRQIAERYGPDGQPR